MSPRDYSWHLRGDTQSPVSRFRSVCKANGWEIRRTIVHPLGARDVIFTRGTQQIMGEFAASGGFFQAAWLHASADHRGVRVFDEALVGEFIERPQSWAIEHASEWLSMDEGSVVERSLKAQYGT